MAYIRLPARASSLLTHGKTHGWCPGCSECTCLYGFPANVLPERALSSGVWNGHDAIQIRGSQVRPEKWTLILETFRKQTAGNNSMLIKEQRFYQVDYLKSVKSKSYILMSTVESTWVLYFLNYVRITTNSVVHVILNSGPSKAPGAFSLKKKILVIKSKLICKEHRFPGGWKYEQRGYKPLDLYRLDT